jgi:hypothetical protein
VGQAGSKFAKSGNKLFKKIKGGERHYEPIQKLEQVNNSDSQNDEAVLGVIDQSSQEVLPDREADGEQVCINEDDVSFKYSVNEDGLAEGEALFTLKLPEDCKDFGNHSGFEFSENIIKAPSNDCEPHYDDLTDIDKNKEFVCEFDDFKLLLVVPLITKNSDGLNFFANAFNVYMFIPQSMNSEQGINPRTETKRVLKHSRHQADFNGQETVHLSLPG